MPLKRDLHHDQTHVRNTTTGLVDYSIIENVDSLQYNQKPGELFQQPLCDNDDFDDYHLMTRWIMS